MLNICNGYDHDLLKASVDSASRDVNQETIVFLGSSLSLGSLSGSFVIRVPHSFGYLERDPNFNSIHPSGAGAPLLRIYSDLNSGSQGLKLQSEDGIRFEVT